MNLPFRGTLISNKGSGGLAEIQFESGQNVIFIVPENQSGLLTEIVEDHSLNMGDLRLVFGDLMKRSAYEQYGVLLNTTPESIQAFGPRAEAVRGVTLLTIKAIAFGPGLEREHSRLVCPVNVVFKSVTRRNLEIPEGGPRSIRYGGTPY